MTTDDITLRSPAPDEMRAFMQPTADAFNGEMSQPEFEAERQLLEPERCVSAFVGDERVGSAAAYTFRLTVPGGEVGAAGITGVGVRPDHRRRGLLRRMMTWLHDDALRRGEPVAVLGASEAAIYQRFGYGQGTTQSTFSVDPARIRFREPIGPDPSRRIRMVDEDEAMRLFRRSTTGFGARSRAQSTGRSSSGGSTSSATPIGCATAAGRSGGRSSRSMASHAASRSIG